MPAKIYSNEEDGDMVEPRQGILIEPVWKHSFSGFFGCSDEERAYQNFMRSKNRLPTQLFGTIVGFAVHFGVIIQTWFSEAPHTYSQFVYVRASVLILFLLNPFVVMGDKGIMSKILPFHTVYFQGACCVFHALVYGIFLYGMTFRKGCDSNPGHYQICNGVMPADQCMIYIIVTTAAPAVLKCRHISAVALSILIQIFFLCLTAFYVDMSYSTTGVSILITLAMQCMILFECENFSRQMYLNQTMAIQSHKTMLNAENRAVLKELRTTEMRHLFGNVAHDLKTPLQAFSFEMDAITSLVRSGGIDTSVADRIERSVDVMRNTSVFFQMVINRVLDYSKASSGVTLQPYYQPESLRELLDRVKKWVRCFDHSRGADNITVTLLSEVCDFIVTDHQWLAENLLCLASNAQKYSKSGRVVIRCFLIEGSAPSVNSGDASTNNSTTITFRTHRTTIQPTAQQMLVFEVIDDGAGVSASKRKSIFQPVDQASRLMGGTGLGLYALNQRVEALGGLCGVRDREDRKSGACFWFSIPYEASNSDAIMSLVATSPSPLESWTTDDCEVMPASGPPEETLKCDSSAKILIVDDSALIRKTAARALHNGGMASDLAENGAVCLEKLAAENYKMILMDIQMPVMNGIECTKRIRDMERDSGVPRLVIIGMSANSDSDTRNEAMAAGMDGFLSKPVHLAHLKQFLRTLNCV
jgi:signal transduction histidine kinase/ActR/RegA family two-component response regulator